MQSSTSKRTSKMILSLSHPLSRHHCPRPSSIYHYLFCPPLPEPSTSLSQASTTLSDKKISTQEQKTMCPRANYPLLSRFIIDTLGTTPRKSTTQKNQKHNDNDADHKAGQRYNPAPLARYSPFSPSLFCPLYARKPSTGRRRKCQEKYTLGGDDDNGTPPARAGYD